MRRLRRILLWLIALAFVGGICAVFVVRSAWFLNQVRSRILMEFETATGGRAEIRALSFDWTKGEAHANGIVLHGLEPAGTPPLLRVENLDAGLTIHSLWNRDVTLRSLRLQRPEVQLIVNGDGTSNIPEPKQKRAAAGTWSEDLLRLKAGRFEVVDGLFAYNDRKVPFAILAEKLNASMDYESNGPRYRGALKAASVRLQAEGIGTIAPSLDTAFVIAAKQMEFSRLKLDTKFSHVDLRGKLTNLERPRGEFDVKASVAARDVPKVPVTSGTALIDGKLRFDTAAPFDYGFRGSVQAKGIGYRRAGVDLQNASAQANVDLTPTSLVLRNLYATALDASFRGSASIDKWTYWKVDGDAAHAHARTILEAVQVQQLPWDGVISGHLKAEGSIQNGILRNIIAAAQLSVTPAADGAPLTGRIDALYEQIENRIRLRDSYLATTSTRVEASGTVGEQVLVKAQSTDLRDLFPVLALIDKEAKLPLELRGGMVRVEGALNGPIDNIHFGGNVQATKFRGQGHDIERLIADVDATKSLVKLAKVTIDHAHAAIGGAGQFALNEWRLEDGAIAGQLQIRDAQIANLAKEFGQAIPLEGAASATVQLSGTARHPISSVTLQSAKLTAYGETLSAVRATAKLTDALIDVPSIQADLGGARLRGSGRLEHPSADYQTGTIQFEVSTDALTLAALRNWRENAAELDGRLQGKLSAAGKLVNGELTVTAVNGSGAVRGITFEQRRAGDLTFSAVTNGTRLTATSVLNLRSEIIEADAEFQLTGEYPGAARIRFPKLTVATLHDLRPTLGGWEQLPFEGFVSGTAMAAGTLKKWESMQGEMNIAEVQVSPKASQKLRLGVQTRDVVLRNAKPFKIVLNRDRATIEQTEFIAQSTRLGVSGQVAFDSKVESNVALNGNINLAILQILNADLLAKGDAALSGTLRGSLSEPHIRGKLELKKASLYLTDFPNGVDNANGTVSFDDGRATIDKLTAETGGGQIKFSGFVEFAGAALVYRLQAQAESVRVRYPEDLSVTFHSQLSLSGTSENSLLSGTVSVNKMSFQPRTDLGQLLANTAKPVPTVAAPNEYLRGMQFDVHIESGAEMQVNTSLSNNVQAEVDLRLRGSPIRPVLLGSVSVDSGDIQVFGNRYTIDRGEIRFFNPVKIEPVFDMDLETKARGITVNISFSGTLSKLNATYRSDPPLQTREIIALLAVGRDPGSSSGTRTDSPAAQSSFLQAGNSLLGQAVSAQLSNRLQRFFGVSRLKIDPQLTGVEALPQARLTLEQQVSRDITVTYITNLNRTQEQIVRVQWDVGKDWSIIALRDGNGVFGLDMQFRKRFK